MARTSLEIEVIPKFVIDTDTAYQCLSLLEMYCDSHNMIVESTHRRSKGGDWHVNLEFKEVTHNEA